MNAPFERHWFSQMEKALEESVDQLVCCLHQRAISCKFANTCMDEAMRDRLTEMQGFQSSSEVPGERKCLPDGLTGYSSCAGSTWIRMNHLIR